MPPRNAGIEDLIKQFNIPNITNTYYTTNIATKIEGANITQCGGALFVESDLKNCKEIKGQLTNINGQSLTFLGSEELYYVLIKNLFNNVVFTESVGNIKCCYGLNNKLNNNIKIEGKSVNLQIAINNNTITIGTPVILGSY